MKKLFVACGALFVIGCSLLLVGKVSGGTLYAPYRHGCHPVHSPLQLLFPSYRHGWWFGSSDDVKKAVDDAFDGIGDAMDDALDAVDSGLNDALDTVHEAVHDLY